MNGFRIPAAIGATLACFALSAAAQPTTTTDPKKVPKAEATKDQKAMDAPKADAKKAEPKKAAPKKAPPRKAPPKKPVDGKVQPTAGGGTVQKFEAGKAPDLKDSKGNTVSSSPDAYDISSATKPAPKKK